MNKELKRISFQNEVHTALVSLHPEGQHLERPIYDARDIALAVGRARIVAGRSRFLAVPSEGKTFKALEALHAQRLARPKTVSRDSVNTEVLWTPVVPQESGEKVRLVS